MNYTYAITGSENGKKFEDQCAPSQGPYNRKASVEKIDGKYIVTCETPCDPPFAKKQIKETIAGALIAINEILTLTE